MSNLKPSEKAIEAAWYAWNENAMKMISALESAYAIDVDPLIEQKDKEIERLTDELMEGPWEEVASKDADIAELKERIAELEAEIYGLCKVKQDLADENSRLKDLLETYVPKDERAGTPDQTRM